ncbi:hypothetical protein BSKO_06969 [Bryopsis sp. KO-2023]|nr:hypothetical protein BSKO_06969 [Bryopsis sp. KO-2023]
MGRDPWADVEDIEGRAHYKTLGIPHNATIEEVRRAYRQLVRKSHPDKGGDAQAFARVRAAYELLSDPVRRAVYDDWASVLEFRYVQGVANRAEGGEDILLKELEKRGVRCDAKTQLVVTCEVCRRPATKECWVCKMQICEFCVLKRHWKGHHTLHWPLINSQHMRTTLAQRELEQKRVEDARVADMSVPNYRSQLELQTIRSFKAAAQRQWTRDDRQTHYEYDVAKMYMWAQSESHVILACHIPTGYQDKCVEVDCTESAIKIQPENSPPVVERRLSKPISSTDQLTCFKTKDNRFYVLVLPKLHPSIWNCMFEGDSDGVRCLEPPYTLYELEDEVVLEMNLPFWIETSDVDVTFTEGSVGIWVRNICNIRRDFWTKRAPPEKNFLAVQMDSCSWCLNEEVNGAGDKIVVLTVTLVRPELTESEIQWKRGIRQDNRQLERNHGGRKGFRFLLDDEDEFGLEDILQAACMKYMSWTQVPSKPWNHSDATRRANKPSQMSSEAQAMFLTME